MFKELNQYKENWEKEKTVTITNLFSDEDANEIWSWYATNRSFSKSFFTGDADADGHVPLVFADEGTEEYDKLTERVNQKLDRNEFTYRFGRTQEMHPKLVQMWQSKLFIGALEYITGYDTLEWYPDSTFTSKYEEGDFLGAHTDENHGKIAFVYQLTKDWIPQYGGLFLRMPDWRNVDKTVVPQFNELTLFEVSGNGIPHMVTQVSNGVKKMRMGYSGWLR